MQSAAPDMHWPMGMPEHNDITRAAILLLETSESRLSAVWKYVYHITPGSAMGNQQSYTSNGQLSSVW